MLVLNIIPEVYFADLFLVASLISVLVLGILGLVFYKRFAFISIPITIVLASAIITLPNFITIPEFVFIVSDVLFLGLIVVAIIEFIRGVNLFNKQRYLANYFLKNAVYDYSFSTNKKDKLIDASDSYLDLVSLEVKDLKKSKGLSTMLSEIKIKKINGRASNDATLKFQFDYEKATEENELYQFDLEVLIDEEVVFLKGIIQPIYYKDKFIGRNVYLMNDLSATFTSLRSKIIELETELETANKQTYALMSLTKHAIMYYDYKTSTYVATEGLNNYLEVNQKEFTIEEFFDMIHPDDLASYQEAGAMINSMMPNRTKLRLYINKKYYDVYDDSLYLNKDSNLVSIISLVSDPELVSVKHQEEVKNATMWATLEELNPTDVMDDLLNELESTKKDETDE